MAPSLSRQSSVAIGYFKKHWRGDLSLPVSFWLNSFLANIVAFILVFIINASIQGSLNPVQILLALVSIYVLLLGITVWQITGTWRSAEKHKNKTGRKGWAIAAQIVIILAIIQLVKPYYDGSKQIIEIVQIATGTDKSSEFEIELKNDTDLHIVGYMAFKLVGTLDKYLNENQNIKTIHLTSPGGRIGPAFHISNSILSKKLNTYAEIECDSACTIVFIGGNNRVISVGTKLGFHRGAMPGISETEMHSIQIKERNYFLSRGIPEAFLRKAYGTPSNQMWYPTYRELMLANVVTHIKVGKKIVPIRRYCRTENCREFSTAPIWLQVVAARANLKVPQTIDKTTVFNRAISGPKKHLTYLFTLRSIEHMNFDRVDQKIGNSSCNNQKIAILFNNGITMHWKYRGPGGRFLHEVTLSPDDCKNYRTSSH